MEKQLQTLKNVLEEFIYSVSNNTFRKNTIKKLAKRILFFEIDKKENINSILMEISNNASNIQDLLKLDAEAIFNNDPAADSLNQIIYCYPGYKAILYFRVAHEFYKRNLKNIARIITELAHSVTGIDIHPGAEIGKYFAIDHGTGVVVGETTVIGNNVTIYQGVTLGALHLENREQKGQRRHPTVEDNVTIYANATILGGKTVIGKGSTIGANAFVVKSVDHNSKVKMEI